MNVLRNRNISVAYDNFAMFSDYEEFMFFWKNSSSFSLKIIFWTLWEFLLFLSHSTAKLLNSAHFLNLETFLPKPISVSKNPKTWSFWEVLQFQSPSSGNLQHSAYLNTINFSNEEPFSVSKKTQFLKVLRSLTNLVAFYTKVLHFQILNNWKKFQTPISVSKTKPKIWAFRAVILFSDTFHFKSASSSKQFLNISCFIIEKSMYFFQEKKNFARFEKRYSFSSILCEFCSIQHL